MKKIRLATRGSPLALKQAEMAAEFMGSKSAGTQFEIVEIKTSGDKRQDWSLEKFGGQGLFTKEIEDALAEGVADVAVHSAKDLPTRISADFSVFGFLPRRACRDVLALRSGVGIPSLIATGSPRRRAQLKKMFPQAVWTEIRGNVETRLKKIVSGVADATVLSEAGLERLGISSFDGVRFVPLKLDVCVPAVGQGIIALECRASDAEKYASMTDSASADMFALERRFLSGLGGGCQAAFAANFDGQFFRFYHESSGFRKISFPDGAGIAQMLGIVDGIVSTLG